MPVTFVDLQQFTATLQEKSFEEVDHCAKEYIERSCHQPDEGRYGQHSGIIAGEEFPKFDCHFIE